MERDRQDDVRARGALLRAFRKESNSLSPVSFKTPVGGGRGCFVFLSINASLLFQVLVHVRREMIRQPLVASVHGETR